MKDVKEPSQDDMEYAANIMNGNGIKVKIGG